MRLPNDVLKTQDWIIDDIVPDFDVEDVWALPAEGGAHDFPAVVQAQDSLDFPAAAPLPVRLLWGIRDLLGRAFGLGRISTSADAAGAWPSVPGTGEPSLRARLPEDLRDTSPASPFTDKPFRPLYRTDTELAQEISNRTMYGVMHLAWVDQGSGRYRAQMTVYVKPRGTFGKAYMAFIKPFRYAIVYPALMRHFERTWSKQH
ncbi:DUF2867 domain-containing protein [Kribbella speibonae]|uniref:DUF2867 domain-containing protein n=1 Tax=Kribbella speibonae TaxID=1572660 RepID=A0A4R0III3_9ACTN|nr:DUF2867 domain-containing protein [Kribbella speibonae]TCC33213.1 DUF2867 domain-containing protein [Kribbella speibonae]